MSTLAKSFAMRMGNATRLGVKPCTLTRVTPGVRSPSNQSGGTNPTTTVHTCKAFVGSFTTTQLADTMVKSSDRMFCIFVETITPAAEPMPGDKITFDGVTYRIVGDKEGLGVRTDPTRVLFTCHARGL